MLSCDGCVEVQTPVETNCCPPPLCGNDLCCTFVAFFNLLPTGPLWDYWKQIAISYFQHSDDPSQCPLLQNPACPSLILHAIYTVLKLKGLVHDALWPALRESNPYTAITTLDYWLSRYQWEDCYRQHCRTVLGDELTPLDIWTICGPVFCEPNFPPDLENAVKHAIVISLSRATMGIIKNLCSLNWLIDPLGAEMVPDTRPYIMQPIYEPCDPHRCNDARFVIRPTRDWLEGLWSGDVCDTQLPPPQVPAYWDQACDRPVGLPDQVWPGLLAAECIIRSILPCAKITVECSYDISHN